MPNPDKELTVSHDTQVKQEVPERIWLIENNDPDATTETEILWSSAPSDAENDLNIEYVRADLLATVRREAFKEARNTVNGLFHNSEVNHSRWNEAITAASAALEASATEKGEMNGSD